MQQAFNCYRCSAQNQIGQPSCWNCGSPFQWNCPNCKAPVNNTMVSCPYCHVVLPWPTQQQNVPRQSPQQPYYQQQPIGSGQQYQQQAQQAYPNMERRYEQPEEKAENKKKKPWLIGCSVLAAIAILIIIIAAISSGGSKSSPSTSSSSSSSNVAQTPVAQAIEVNAGDLYKAYEENSVAADLKYEGKTLLVTGIVESVSKDILNEPYVILTDGKPYSMLGVQCSFSKGSEQELAKLNKGQTVRIQGTQTGYIMHVQLKDCILK